MADTPDPQSVGRELVRQYYTMLNERPDNLHRFFSQNSSYVHGGIEKPGEESPPVRGQQAIHQKILSLGFKDCHAKIRQVDCQETVAGAVVIQVSGELSNNYGPMRRFMQTFVLARQAPKTYYLHNDIFRYQDEVFHDFESSSGLGDAQDVTGDNELDEGEKIASTAEVIQTQNIHASLPEQQTQATVNSLPVEVEKPQEAVVAGTQPIAEAVAVASVAPVVEQQVAVGATDVSSVNPSTPENASSGNKEPDSSESNVTEPRTQLPVQKPFSWASLAGKGTSPSSSTSQTPAAPKPQATIKPERKADANVTNQNQPLPQRTPRSGSHRSDHPVINDSNNDRKWTSFDGGDGKPNAGPAVPDNQQMFVGNLPHNAEDKDLVDFFSKFGNVIDVKINRKGMSRDLPNFGFVSFDSAEAVTKVLAAKPLLLYGRHRLNVEEKKEQSELFSRPRGSGGSGGGRGRGVGSYRGGSYRGGRGAAAAAAAASAHTGDSVNSGSSH